MSTYTAKTKHPLTGKWEEAEWIDDCFGSDNYGVKFPDGAIFDQRTHPCEQEYLATPLDNLIREAINEPFPSSDFSHEAQLREYIERAFELGKTTPKES